MPKPKPLPLDDPRWLPIGDAHKLLCERTGDGQLAANDLTEKLASGDVHCMCRTLDGRRELVPATFWVEHMLSYWQTDDKLLVARRPPPDHKGGGWVISSIRGVFFVWQKDVEECWPTPRAPGAGRKDTFNPKQTAALKQEYRDWRKVHPDKTKKGARKQDVVAHLKRYAEDRFLINAHEDTFDDNIVTPVDQEK